jgi:2-methylisocitrate lyase-like PEP mutase family enzyme
MSVDSFRALHAGERVLVLPNAWDAASAALFVSVGAKAIATTSAGLAWSCGYPDGGALPTSVLHTAVAAVCRAAAGTPVSVDLEDGYSDGPEEVAALVTSLCAFGAVGINIEDRAGDPELLARKIEAVKRAARAGGGDVFVNARTDVYLRRLAEGEAAVRETISRAQRYARAGADGIYAIGLTDVGSVRAIAGATSLPLNLLADPSLPPLHELHALGVRRLSAGPYLTELAYGKARRAAAAFVRDGDVTAMFADPGADFDMMNALLDSAASDRRSRR